MSKFKKRLDDLEKQTVDKTAPRIIVNWAAAEPGRPPPDPEPGVIVVRWPEDDGPGDKRVQWPVND